MLIDNALKAFAVNNDATELVKLIPVLKRNGDDDLQTALLLMKLFESSYPDAQAELGDCYSSGWGLIEDEQKALSLYQSAASSGNTTSKFFLGWYYYEREEFLQAIDNFAYCLAHANDLDDKRLEDSYVCIGDAYSKISEPKITTAIENLAIAVDRYHNSFACRRLAALYSETNTPYFNAEKTIKYYELGASYGDDVSAHRIGMAYLYGDDDLKITSNGRKALSVLQPFEDSDNVDILADLGALYQFGDEDNGVARDPDKARLYYERAYAQIPDPYVASNLGYMYVCLGDFVNAEKMLLVADQADYCGYSDFLGRIYNEGSTGVRDVNKAEYYYGRAYQEKQFNNIFTCDEYAALLMEMGNYQKAFDVAEYGLEKYNDVAFVFKKAKLVLDGKVNNRIDVATAADDMEVVLNYHTPDEGEAYLFLGKYYQSLNLFQKAEIYYKNAFDKGCADAGVFLGRLYENGGGTSIAVNTNQAYMWYSKAGEAGSSLGAAEAACFKNTVFGKWKRVDYVRQ